MSLSEDYCRFENISEERERELFADRNREDYREEIINSHLKLIIKIAAKYSFLPHTLREDLIQEGTVGLVMSMNRFNPDLGFRFSTFASFYIRNSMRSFLRKQYFLFSIPNDKLYQLFKVINRYKQSSKIDPEEIAQIVNCSHSYALELLSSLFFQERYCNENRSFRNINIEALDQKLKILEVNEIIKFFDNKDQLIMKLRYSQGKTWREISQETGMSHEGCRKRHDKIIELIRSQLLSHSNSTKKKSTKDLVLAG